MKSMLQEASSVAIAIEKAWNNSGNPEEFTIKILELGDKSFWGNTKRPAIVSITYDPKKQTKKPVQKRGGKEVVQKPYVKVETVKKEEKKKDSSSFLKSLFGKSKPAQDKKDVSHKDERRNFEQKSSHKRISSHGWNEDLANQATVWLKEIFQIMGIKVNVSIKLENRILNVLLDREVLTEKEDEKLFFISISHLLMQFLKKKHKKRFQNFYLIIHSKTLNTKTLNAILYSFPIL